MVVNIAFCLSWEIINNFTEPFLQKIRMVVIAS